MVKNIKFHSHDILEIAGVTPIGGVTDRQIWSSLVTPMVKGLLGGVVASHVQLMETQRGLFPGDEVANLNDHRLFGGEPGYVRFPYLHTSYRTEYGAFIVKRDGVKFEAKGWFGDLEKGRAQLIFKVAMRDRRYDGTLRANDSALVDFPYNDPVLNGRLPFDASSVEASTYGFLPGSSIVDADGDGQFDSFVEKPFMFLDRPELFLSLFHRAWASKRAPGQNAAPIADVARLIPVQLEKIAAAAGYDFIEGAPSHYHVALWSLANGYRFTDKVQAQTISELVAGIKRVQFATRLSRSQESWLTVVQSLRPTELIPAGLNLHGPQWPQDNIGPQNLWIYKPVSDKARALAEKSAK